MRFQSGALWFELDASLVNEALSAASRMASDELRSEYREEREAIASIEIVDIREQSFRDLDAHWIDRFGVIDALRSLVDEEHPLSKRVSGFLLEGTRDPLNERAWVEPGRDGLPLLVVSLKAETLLSLHRLRDLLETVT
jgi:hypothetical protein